MYTVVTLKRGNVEMNNSPQAEIEPRPLDFKSSTLPNELKRYPTSTVLVVSCTDKPQPLHNILMIDYIQQKLQYATLFINTYSFGVTKRYDMLWFYYWHFIFFLKIALFVEQFTPKLIFYTLKMQ